jgi:glycosyltransferase involved in cell wall biosynthesis
LQGEAVRRVFRPSAFLDVVKMKPLVSIIIPAFNAEKFLRKTLLSVQQQTYERLEIIIVNDGSTDSSDQIAAECALSDQRIKIISQTNSGVASARNHGLQCSSGDYVAFLDADDIWHPAKIERQVEVLLASTNGTGRGSVYPLHRYIDSEDRIVGSGRFWSMAGDPAIHLATLRTECGSKILTRRDLALAVGGYDTDLNMNGAEDLDFELKLAARFPMFVVSEYLVGYRKFHGTLSGDDARMVRALRAVINRYIDRNGLSKSGVNWVLGEFHKHFLFIFLDKHKFTSALKSMIGLICSDPGVALNVLVFQLPERIRAKIFKRIFKGVGYHSPPNPRFYDVSSLELIKLPRASGRWDPPRSAVAPHRSTANPVSQQH